MTNTGTKSKESTLPAASAASRNEETNANSSEDAGESSQGSLVKDLFATETNARAATQLIAQFVQSWERNKNDATPGQWLEKELGRFPEVWGDQAAVSSVARQIVLATEQSRADHQSFHAHRNAGGSKESWVAKELEKSAAAAGVTNVGSHAAAIEAALEKANAGMLETITTQSGAVSGNPNLDGLIAEQHHVNTFNLDASTKGSALRARVLRPEPGRPFPKNSVDVGIYDGGGKLVRRYQLKFGKHASATRAQLKKGDIRGQTPVVPSEQKSEIRRSVDAIEMDGVRSTPLSKEQAKRWQQRVQQDGEPRRYDWNSVSRIDIAKSMGKQMLLSAAIAAGFQGARIATRRIWNDVVGKDNPPASEDLQEFFKSTIGSTARVGAQVAVSGAVMLAAKQGLIGVLRNTPPARIANIVYVGMENAKVLYKYSEGELSGEEAFDAMGDATFSAIGMLAGGAKGATLGAAGGPIGAFVGGVVGSMAGSAVGRAVYEGGKKFVRVMAKAMSKLAEPVAGAAKAVGRVLSPANW